MLGFGLWLRWIWPVTTSFLSSTSPFRLWPIFAANFSESESLIGVGAFNPKSPLVSLLLRLGTSSFKILFEFKPVTSEIPVFGQQPPGGSVVGHQCHVSRAVLCSKHRLHKYLIGSVVVQYVY